MGSADESLGEFLSALGSKSSTPGGGAAAALALGLGAACAQMVANFTVGRRQFAEVDEQFRDLERRAGNAVSDAAELADLDATAFEQVRAAWTMPKEPEAAATERAAAMHAALVAAAQVPLRVMSLAVEVIDLAAAVLAGNQTVASDAGVAAILAAAALDAADLNVEANLVLIEDHGFVLYLRGETTELLTRGHAQAAVVVAGVRQALGA